MILLMILPTVSLFELIAEMCVIELKFFFLAALWHMEYPGQESDPSCSCNLRHSLGNLLNPLCSARDRT